MLRVISGLYKHKQLHEVSKEITRPTTDRNKEMLFNILGQYFEGGKMLDLFAGSGAIGIEGLSRGLDECIFVDQNRLAIQTIQKNLDICQLIPSQKVQIVQNSAESFLKSTKEKFDLIFIDPPYQSGLYEMILSLIEHMKPVNPEVIIVTESLKGTQFQISLNHLSMYREVTKGNTTYRFYEWKE